MSQTYARSLRAVEALRMVEALQERFVARLGALPRAAGAEAGFRSVTWLRDGGRHGGGRRLANPGDALFDRASVNVSQVHYDDEPARKLGSATALSTIVHPRNPRAPSVHIHLSWTELRNGPGYWRVMADLNPALAEAGDTAAFEAALRAAAPEHYEEAKAQGERYFFVPVLGRHRGVAHFYLEGLASRDPDADRELARRVGEAAIDRYAELLEGALGRATTDTDRAAQLAYHTLYFFQVLTLDRGTSAGLLVHDQNDVGILGSLPARVDARLLASWAARMPVPQDELLERLLAALPAESPAAVEDDTKVRLAAALRAHYRAHPEALALQASGDTLPPTVDNHLGRP